MVTMEANWPKISEILFQAAVTGVISAITVIAAYLLGRKQSDINWKRELEQKEKELSLAREQLEVAKKSHEREVIDSKFERRRKEQEERRRNR